MDVISFCVGYIDVLIKSYTFRKKKHFNITSVKVKLF